MGLYNIYRIYQPGDYYLIYLESMQRRVLVTSDDGYDSIGVRLLVRHLKNTHEVVVAGTKDQMSGVGGKLTISGGAYGLTQVEGVEALVVEAAPADAVEVAAKYYGTGFDWVISGINWGANIGGGLISSGTYGAAFRAMTRQMAEHAIAISWHVDPKYWFYRHTEDKSHLVDELDAYPGRVAVEMVLETIHHEAWGAKIVNINLPRETSRRYQFTTPLDDIGVFYLLPELDPKAGSFVYPYGDTGREIPADSDLEVLSKGEISVTLCQATMMDVGRMDGRIGQAEEL